MIDLLKEAEKLEAKADKQYMDYMDNGSPNTIRSCERNRDIAQVYRDAYRAKDIKDNLNYLTWRIQMLDTKDPLKLVKQVESLVNDVNEGKYL